MQKLILQIMTLLVLVAFATPAKADDYGDIATKLETLEIADIISAHSDVTALPDSDVNRLFKSGTQILMAVVNDDGGETTTITELINEYGVTMGTALDSFSPMMSGTTNLFDTSTKSLNDARDFLATWKVILTESIALLDQISSDFEYTMTLQSGVQVQLDYTDVLLLKAAYQLSYGFIELICAHDMDKSISQLNDPAFNQGTDTSFMEYRTDKANYLAASKQWCLNALDTCRTMLTTLENEPATPAGVEEVFFIDSRYMTQTQQAVDDLINNLNSDVIVDFGDNFFHEFDMNVVFDGNLSLAQFVPEILEVGLRFSSTGYKLGCDPTLNNMFPRATHPAWNLQWVQKLEVAPFNAYWNKGFPLTDTSSLTEVAINVGVSEVLTMDLNWQDRDVTIQSWGSSVFLGHGNAWVDLSCYFNTSDPAATLHYSKSTDQVVIHYECVDGIIEYTIQSDGTISITTDTDTPLDLRMFVYDTSIDSYRGFTFGNALSNQSVLLSQTGTETTATTGSGFIPAIQSLLH